MSLRSSGTWKTRLGACAAAFALTGIAVYFVGTMDGAPGISPQPHTVEAKVCGCTAGASARSPLPDLETLRQQILGDDTLGKALASQAQPAPNAAALARIRRNVELKIDRSQAPERFVVSIRCTGEDASEATRLVNSLARATADWIRQRALSAETSAREAVSLAQKATDRAQRHWEEARTQRERLLDQHFSRLNEEADRLQAWSEAASTLAPPTAASRFVPTKPVPVHVAQPARPAVENPAWTELNEELQALEQRHTELLAQRTALHPEVREIASRLAQLKRQIAGIPRHLEVLDNEPAPDQTIIPPLPPDEQQLDQQQIDESTDNLADAGAEMATDPSRLSAMPPRPPDEVARAHRAAAETFAEQSQQLEQARREFEQRLAEQRLARDNVPTSWRLRLELASIPPPPDVSQERFPLGLYCLIAAVTAAASVGVLGWIGPSDRPFTNVAEVQASLPVPVIGALPTTANMPAGSSRQKRSRQSV